MTESRLVEFTLLQLLQHNVQLGAPVKFSLLSSHWFIFGVRQRFALINLSQTVVHYRYFLEVINYAILGRRRMLFVNERRYTSLIVSDVASSVGEAYVMGRWVGGSLTNFKRIWLMYHRLLKFKADSVLPQVKLNLKNLLRGLCLLKALPSVIFFNSVRHSTWASGEAHALLIPAGGITDTDASPRSLLYPIPGNDDAFGSVYFLNRLVAKVILISKISVMLDVYTEFCSDWQQWSKRLEKRRLWRKRKRQRKRKFI